MLTPRLAAFAVAAFLPFQAGAFSTTGLSFTHHDWELACDNTGTCRAAGYHPDEAGENSISVLLTRHAGPNQPVTAQVMLGKYGDNEVVDSLPAKFSLTLKINGKVSGKIGFEKASLQAAMSPEQANALATALARRADIQLNLGAESWRLSDKGATAVLLKMDEYQGRLETPGALVRKGQRPESGVPARQPAPEFKSVPFAKPLRGDKDFAGRHRRALLDALRNTADSGSCEDLQSGAGEDSELTATRLDASHMLVSARCWLAAYNSGNGYWIVEDRPPFKPVLVTTDADGLGDGRLVASSKGRGLGDCWSHKAWGWNGKDFQVVEEYSTGMCKLIAPGGAWSLPTIVTKER